jgi:uncharacterized membrane protein YcaP (DUF421 family)
MIYVEIAAKLSFGLVALILVTRLLGKKSMADLTPFDFIYSVILGGFIEEALYDPNVNLVHVGFSIGVWGVLMYLVEKGCEKFDKVRIWVKGQTSILIKNGKFNPQELAKNELDMEQVRSVLRQQGIFSLNEVKDLLLEPGGQFSVNKYKNHSGGQEPQDVSNPEPAVDDNLTYLFVDRGDINRSMLKQLDKSEEWLREQLEKRGYPALERLLYAEWSPEQGFYVKTKQDSILHQGEIN